MKIGIDRNTGTTEYVLSVCPEMEKVKQSFLAANPVYCSDRNVRVTFTTSKLSK